MNILETSLLKITQHGLKNLQQDMESDTRASPVYTEAVKGFIADIEMILEWIET